MVFRDRWCDVYDLLKLSSPSYDCQFNTRFLMIKMVITAVLSASVYVLLQYFRKGFFICVLAFQCVGLLIAFAQPFVSDGHFRGRDGRVNIYHKRKPGFGSPFLQILQDLLLHILHRFPVKRLNRFLHLSVGILIFLFL